MMCELVFAYFLSILTFETDGCPKEEKKNVGRELGDCWGDCQKKNVRKKQHGPRENSI